MPFLKSFAPGKKSFDFYIAQVSNKPERRRAVTFSASYYVVNQAVAGLKSNPIAQGPLTRRPEEVPPRSVRSGRRATTTSSRYIKPDQAPRVYDSVNDVVTAVKTKQIDGMVHDFPSMGYVTNVQIPGSTVVGRLPAQGVKEHFGLVFQKGNPLVRCVNRAVNAMRADGTLKKLEVRWLGRTGAPILK